MTHPHLLILLVATNLLTGCAATLPSELASARTAYLSASEGPAASLVPAELHKARESLALAEAAFKDDPRGYHTRDLAYVAQRKAELAQALAVSAAAQRNAAVANSQYQATQDAIMLDTRSQLGAAQSSLTSSQVAAARSADQLAASQAEAARTAGQLTASEYAGAETAAQLAASESGRADAEARASAAMAALARLAAVREESRGLVITLSGSVLFRSDEATLLPEASSRLGDVADALAGSRDRALLVEGHTDSQGSEAHNQDLAQRRAEAVRAFLIERGSEPSRTRAVGIGEARPIADNATAEGRANNRRVEIILEPVSTAAQ